MAHAMRVSFTKEIPQRYTMRTRRISVFFFVAAALIGGWSPAVARPLLTNSEDTYASVCIGYADTPDRLIQICELALSEDGASQGQQLAMMDSLAWSLYETGDMARSEALFREMLELDARSHLALLGLGWFEWDRDAYDAAEALFVQATGIKATAQAIAGTASSRYRAGKLTGAEAVEALQAAQMLNPEYTWAIREEGFIQTDLANYPAGEVAFRRALEFDEADISALFGLARTLRYQERGDEALEVINQQIALEGETLSNLWERASTLLELDRVRMAERDADRMIALAPGVSDGAVMKARAQFWQGRADSAIALLNDHRDEHGLNPNSGYWLGLMYFWDERYTDALNLFDMMAEESPLGEDHLGLVFDAAFKLKQFDRAQQAVEMALDLNPASFDAVYQDAMLKAQRKEFDAAEARLQQALDMGRAPDAVSHFMNVLAAHGEYVRMIRLRVEIRDRMAN